MFGVHLSYLPEMRICPALRGPGSVQNDMRHGIREKAGMSEEMAQPFIDETYTCY